MFHVFLKVVDCTFYKSDIKTKCNIIIMSGTRKKQSSGRVLWKRHPSQNSQENTCARVSFLKKGLWHRCFPVSFTKFLRTPFLKEHLRWLLLAFRSESTLDSFRTSCSKQAQYLQFMWTVTSWKYSLSNIVQTSSLCYVAGF